MKIDTILFDLDNTLFDFNKAERIALTKAPVSYTHLSNGIFCHT